MTVEPTPSKTPPGKRLFERRLGNKVYRAYIPKEWRDDHLMLLRFGTSKHGEDKFNWFRGWVEEHWPEPIFFFDRWSELFFAASCGWKEKVEELTGYKITATHEWWRFVLAAGAGSSGKTSRVAMWFLANWLVAQEHTSCVLTSTSIDQLKRRTWSEIIHYISNSRHGFKGILEVVSSDTVIRLPSTDTDPSNTKRAIFGRAVDQGGSTQAAVDRIKGVHSPRMFVAVDEMGSVPEAITKACRNLKKGTKEFQFFGLANPNSHDDQHGIYCEPLEGWNNISVDDEFWLTAKGGCCIHFDAYKSPGLKEPEKFHFYPNQHDIDEDIKFHGGENDPGFWQDTRGFWSPIGIGNTVMDGAILEQFHTRENVIWKGSYTMCAFLDPAFEGGDRAVLQIFKLGDFTTGQTGIEYQDPIVVAVDLTQDKRFLHYQLADKVQQHCEEYIDRTMGKKNPILPENFMMDTSGEGGGLFSIMSGRWSPLIKPCEFGGAADKTQIHPDRPTTWHELYANRVTMLWYVLRRYIEGDQIRGLNDPETRTELTSRPKDKPRGGKIALLPKAKVKGMKHRSPDKADAAVGAAQILFQRGINFGGSTGATNVVTVEAWNRWASKTNQSDDSQDYTDAGANFA